MSSEPGGRKTRDWAAVRRRLAEAARLTEEAITPPPDRARRILDERARALAEPPPEVSSVDGLQVISFGLEGATYLIESRYVKEVLKALSVVPVPRTPGYLAGLTNIRGELVPVFALQAYYGSSSSPSANDARAMVLGKSRFEFAVPVDWIEPASHLPATTILSVESGDHRKHVRGLTSDGRILLDGAALLEERDLYLQS